MEWEDSVPEYQVELWIGKHWEEFLAMGGVTIKERWEHWLDGVCLMYPEPLFIRSKWAEILSRAWCENDFATIWGPAASSKSNTIGLFVLCDWMLDPEETLSYVCSTSQKALEKRVWEAIVRYFKVYEGRIPGYLSRSRTAIVNSEKDDEAGDLLKAGIFGIAVLMGSVEDAKSNIIGTHLPFVRLIVDEMQATREAAVEARSNLSKGVINFKFVGLGNPSSRLNPLGKYSMPLDGWSTIGINSKEWKTKFGMCYHLDGFDSPAIENPAKYPFLINQKQIDDDIRDYGVDSPHVWTMCRGFIPAEGITRTVISETQVANFQMMDSKINWLNSNIRRILCIDPAYSAGGDRCPVALLECGRLEDEKIVINIAKMWNIQFTTSEHATDHIGAEVKKIADIYNIPLEDIACDDSGYQSAADAIENAFSSRGITRIKFTDCASEMPVSTFNLKPANEVYKNYVTELWYNVAEFGRHHQIRNLPVDAAEQLCTRRVLEKMPTQVEPKDAMKQVYGRSPDEMDCIACGVALLRRKYGIHPGCTEPGVLFQPGGASNPTDYNEQENTYQDDALVEP